MKSFINYIKPFITVSSLFVLSIILLKVVDTTRLLIFDNILNFNFIIRSFCYNFIASCFISILFFPLFLLISLIKKRIALIIIYLLFGILLVIEIGLTIFTIRSGALMGAEIIVRPLSETLNTINASINTFYSLSLILLILGVFTFLVIYLNKKKIPFRFYILFFLIIIGGSIFSIKLDSLIKKEELNQPVIKNYITNKSFYSLRSTRDYLNWQRNDDIYTDLNTVIVNENELDIFIKNYPEREIPDKFYPLERLNSSSSTLSPFFKEAKSLPNIVIIIAESLGREWSGPSIDGISYTPFLDSLAGQGLYWKNCISTTPRSFGAVPAITGSVPHGRKGFQFGRMPENNTLISILKYNAYKTNVFYAGSFSFDNIREYLTIQGIDYFSLFYEDYRKNSNELNGTIWGYHDEILFNRTFVELNSGKFDNPMLNLIITISSHDALNEDNPNFKKAFEETDKIIATVPNKLQRFHKSHRNRISGIVYLDNCIKEFLEDYKKRDDYENTIFIITGDHASESNIKNDLSMFHVPLIIYSPLIKIPKQFPAIVSHNDITPSLISLLCTNFKLNRPKYINWVGNDLDTISTFRSKQKNLFYRLAKEINEIIYNEFYFNEETDNIFYIDENMAITEVINPDSIKIDLSQKLENFKYINNYVYYNNRLSKHILLKSDKFKNILQITHKDSIFTQTPETRGWFDSYILLPTNIPPPPSGKSWSKLKVSLNANIKFLDDLTYDEHLNLRFSCKGENMKNINTISDKVTKFITDTEIKAGEWNNLDVSKIFYVEEASDIKVFIYLFRYDDEWVENNRVVIKDVSIKIEGIENI